MLQLTDENDMSLLDDRVSIVHYPENTTIVEQNSAVGLVCKHILENIWRIILLVKSNLGYYYDEQNR